MKILIVLPNDSLGGAEQYLKMIANYHKNDIVEIFFLRRIDGGLWSDLPKSIVQKHLSKSSYLGGLLSFVLSQTFGKRSFYDRIYTSHIYITAIIGMLIKTGLIKKNNFIARESTSIFMRFKGFKLFTYKMAYKFGYQNIDLLICQTDFMKNQLVDNFRSIEQRTKVVVFENPIDIDLIKTQEKVAFDYLPPKKFIVSAGRLIPEKGFDLLIDAFASIRSNFPNTKLLILGDGPQKENLIQLANSLDIGQNVLLPGRVDNVYPYFKKASLCVVSSRIEGFPNVLLQMMSQNNSVVSTLCAGGIEKIPGIQTIPTHSKKELINAIQFGLANDFTENRKVLNAYLTGRDISNFVYRLNNTLIKM